MEDRGCRVAWTTEPERLTDGREDELEWRARGRGRDSGRLGDPLLAAGGKSPPRAFISESHYYSGLRARSLPLLTAGTYITRLRSSLCAAPYTLTLSPPPQKKTKRHEKITPASPLRFILISPRRKKNMREYNEIERGVTLFSRRVFRFPSFWFLGGGTAGDYTLVAFIIFIRMSSLPREKVCIQEQ